MIFVNLILIAIAAFLEATTAFYIASLFITKRFIFLKHYSSISLLTLIIFCKVLAVEMLYINGLLGIVLVYSALLLLITDDFNLTYSRAFKKVLIIFGIMIISELIIGAIMTILNVNYNYITLIERFIFSIGATSLNIVITIIITFLFLEKYHRLKVDFAINYMILLHIISFSMATFVYYLAIWNFNVYNQTFLYLMNMILLIILTIIICSNLYRIRLLREKNSILNDYVERFKEVLTTQRKITHEHLNDLIIMESLFKKGEMQELSRYLKKLLNNFKLDNYEKLFHSINHLNNNQIQNVLLYKLMQLDNLKIQYFLNIESNLVDFSLTKREEIAVAKSIAVFLDNVIDNQQTDQFVLIDFVNNKKELTVEITNKFCSYSRPNYQVIKGVGLLLVKGWTAKNNIEVKTQIINNLYVQSIIIRHPL